MLSRLAAINAKTNQNDFDEAFKRVTKLNAQFHNLPGITRIYNELIGALGDEIDARNIIITTQDYQVKALRKQRLLTIFLALAVFVIAFGLMLQYFREKRNNKALFSTIEELRKNTKYYSAMADKKAPQSEDSGLLSKLHSHFRESDLYLEPDLDIDAELKKIGTNRRAANAVLKESLDINIGEYLRDLKLGHALELLRSTNDTIEAIADDCGFNSTRTFLRVFKDRYNLTPTQYRNHLES